MQQQAIASASAAASGQWKRCARTGCKPKPISDFPTVHDPGEGNTCKVCLHYRGFRQCSGCMLYFHPEGLRKASNRALKCKWGCQTHGRATEAMMQAVVEHGYKITNALVTPKQSLKTAALHNLTTAVSELQAVIDKFEEAHTYIKSCRHETTTAVRCARLLVTAERLYNEGRQLPRPNLRKSVGGYPKGAVL